MGYRTVAAKEAPLFEISTSSPSIRSYLRHRLKLAALTVSEAARRRALHPIAVLKLKTSAI
jgi:hypothetical protein